jgi:hypothetical protein
LRDPVILRSFSGAARTLARGSLRRLADGRNALSKDY